LDGLPLAIATAGTFLERTATGSEEYLRAYETNWQEVEETTDELIEYEDRTLFTTWNLSLEQIQAQSAGAAKLFQILAYFGNEHIDYQLLVPREGLALNHLRQILETKRHFDRAMGRLHDFSLVEKNENDYRLHPCVHDWLLSKINKSLDQDQLIYALRCVTSKDISMWSTNYDEVSFRICSHAVRLAHPVFFQQLQSLNLTEELLDDLVHLCNLFRLSDRHEEAKQLATRLLGWCQQTLGPDDLLTLTICNLLGLAAMALRDFITAEEMLRRAMEGLAVVLGEHHQITLDPVHNLANLYVQLGCHGEAERLYLWSLRGCEQSYGWDNPNTFWAAYAIGDFYYETGNLGQAESMYERALKGFDNAIDPDHWFPRKTAISLGHVYSLNKKPDHARLMYQRALDGCERQLGRTHPDTAKILGNLVDLCVKCNDLETIQQLSEHWGKDCLYLKPFFSPWPSRTRTKQLYQSS
jgi:tetratricopeptide (TPR) repeat protein